MHSYQDDKPINTLIKAAEKLKSDISVLNRDNIHISDYSRGSFNHFADNSGYYLSLYNRLLNKAVRKLKKSVSDSTFIDYGGGCGFLSILAKTAGFGTVIYIDINPQSVHDSEQIARALDVRIDFRLLGDIEELLAEIRKTDLSPDLICSFDVIEHIYNLEAWISTAATIDGNFSLFFMTSANPENPLIARRLKKLHFRSENTGYEKNVRSPEGFLNTSFLQERKNILITKYPGLNDADLSLIAANTRGLIKERIEQIAEIYLKSGKLEYIAGRSTNTCDPYTGSWTERLLDLNELKTIAKGLNLKIRYSNTSYAYNNNWLANLIKWFLNILIYLSGNNLFLSPCLIVEIDK